MLPVVVTTCTFGSELVGVRERLQPRTCGRGHEKAGAVLRLQARIGPRGEPLHEKATRRSSPHAVRRNRSKPPSIQRCQSSRAIRPAEQDALRHDDYGSARGLEGFDDLLHPGVITVVARWNPKTKAVVGVARGELAVSPKVRCARDPSSRSAKRFNRRAARRAVLGVFSTTCAGRPCVDSFGPAYRSAWRCSSPATRPARCSIGTTS